MDTTSPVDAAFARILRPGTAGPATVTPFARRAAVYAYASLPCEQQVGADPSITAGAYAEHLRDHLPPCEGFYRVGHVLDMVSRARPAASAFRTFGAVSL